MPPPPSNFTELNPPTSPFIQLLYHYTKRSSLWRCRLIKNAKTKTGDEVESFYEVRQTVWFEEFHAAGFHGPGGNP